MVAQSVYTLPVVTPVADRIQDFEKEGATIWDMPISLHVHF